MRQNYANELFLARFPNLATPDGGWAEGLGCFGLNKSSVAAMALLMKKVGRVDVFKMRRYQILADYFIYFAPLGGRIDGFGDMHDRAGDEGTGEAMLFGRCPRRQPFPHSWLTSTAERPRRSFRRTGHRYFNSPR